MEELTLTPAETKELESVCQAVADALDDADKIERYLTYVSGIERCMPTALKIALNLPEIPTLSDMVRYLVTLYLSDGKDVQLANAVKYNITPLVPYLLSRGANASYGNGQLLILAIRNDNIKMLESLTLHASTAAKNAALIAATGRLNCPGTDYQKRVVALLVNYGANIHIEHDTPLSNAAGKGCLDTVMFLILRGANLHARQDAALKQAVLFDRNNVVSLLLDLDLFSAPSLNEALLLAMKSNNDIITTLLVQHGAKPTE